jgi:hypothetical protein
LKFANRCLLLSSIMFEVRGLGALAAGCSQLRAVELVLGLAIGSLLRSARPQCSLQRAGESGKQQLKLQHFVSGIEPCMFSVVLEG